jgi:hypothetical protein
LKNKQNLDEDEDEEEEENEENTLIGAPLNEESSERGWKRDKRRNNNGSRDNYSGQQKQTQNYNNQYQKQSNYDHKYNNNNNHRPIYVLPTRGPSTIDSIPIIQPPPLIQNPQYFQQQQLQRNNVNIIRQVNRPRSLISIPTHEDDDIVEQPPLHHHQQQPHLYNQPKFNTNGKGIKRACK